MEEKERYEIHIYDDICVDLYNNGVLDKSVNDTYNLENLLKQQDKQIKELEEENKELEIKLDKCGTELVNAESLVSYLENENQQLKQQLATAEKALELACKEITGSCEYCSYKTMIECPVEADCLDEKINYFKTKAKEMLENEKIF